MEISHDPSWYDKEQLPYLTSTQIIFFNEVHIQQVSVTPVTSKVNEHKIRFPRYEEVNIYVKNGKYDTDNQPKKDTFKYEQEGSLFFGVAKIESKNSTIIGKQCPVFNHSGEI